LDTVSGNAWGVTGSARRVDTAGCGEKVEQPEMKAASTGKRRAIVVSIGLHDPEQNMAGKHTLNFISSA
jgi:hypothetical protein